MPAIPITRPTREGHCLVVDISAHQGANPPWQAMKDAGAVAVICKATEGQDFVDKRWAANAREAAEAGLMVGSYHFFRPHWSDPLVQARDYHAAAFDRTALNPVCDFEMQENVDGTVCVERAVAFCEEVERLWKKACLVYCGPGFIGGLKANPAVLAKLARFPLWLADYRDAPHVMAPWSDYAGHQFDDGHKVRIAGVPLDLSFFRGDEIALAKLGASGA